jgi:hypothetical protein
MGTDLRTHEFGGSHKKYIFVMRISGTLKNAGTMKYAPKEER